MNTTTQMFQTLALTAILGTFLVSPATAQCQSKSGQQSCPTKYPPSYGRPVNDPPIDTEPPTDTLPNYAMPALPPDSDNPYVGVSNKAFQCEVQVQHPLTFDWYTARSFDNIDSANEFKTAIQSRYWIIFLPPGTEQPSFLEAASQQDSTAKTSALKVSGSVIRDVRPVTAQVVEESIQSLLGSASAAFAQSQTPVDQTKLATDLSSFTTSKQEPAVSSDLLPLMGLWQAVSDSATGKAQKVLLKLEESGFATLTVPDASGGETTIHRQFAIEQENLILKDGENTITMGKVVSAAPDKVVLERADGILTFIRP